MTTTKQAIQTTASATLRAPRDIVNALPVLADLFLEAPAPAGAAMAIGYAGIVWCIAGGNAWFLPIFLVLLLVGVAVSWAVKGLIPSSEVPAREAAWWAKDISPTIPIPDRHIDATAKEYTNSSLAQAALTAFYRGRIGAIELERKLDIAAGLAEATEEENQELSPTLVVTQDTKLVSQLAFEKKVAMWDAAANTTGERPSIVGLARFIDNAVDACNEGLVSPEEAVLRINAIADKVLWRANEEARFKTLRQKLEHQAQINAFTNPIFDRHKRPLPTDAPGGYSFTRFDAPDGYYSKMCTDGKVRFYPDNYPDKDWKQR